MTFCTAHNAQAGPRGCAHCQRDEALMRRNEGRRFWRGVAFVALPFLAALALAAFFVSRSAADGRLDPRPYREAIVNIEGGLYTTKVLTYETADLLRQGLGQLRTGLRKAFPSPARRRALPALERYCVMTEVASGNAYFDLAAARKEWEQLRAAHFKDAPWFRASSPALEQAQQSDEARGIPGDAAQYQATIDQLRMAAARAEFALRAETSEEDNALDHWKSARDDLKREMDNILQQAPVAFPGMDPAWRKAHTELEKAERAVAGMLSGQGGYRAQKARQAIDAAEAALKAARS